MQGNRVLFSRTWGRSELLHNWISWLAGAFRFALLGLMSSSIKLLQLDGTCGKPTISCLHCCLEAPFSTVDKSRSYWFLAADSKCLILAALLTFSSTSFLQTLIVTVLPKTTSMYVVSRVAISFHDHKFYINTTTTCYGSAHIFDTRCLSNIITPLCFQQRVPLWILSKFVQNTPYPWVPLVIRST